MLADYIRLKSARGKASCGQPRQEQMKKSNQIQQHLFDVKDPWNWKFPQRNDTMSNSTLNESKDQVRIFSTYKMKTSRNHSLNLLTTDVNRKCKTHKHQSNFSFP